MSFLKKLHNVKRQLKPLAPAAPSTPAAPVAPLDPTKVNFKTLNSEDCLYSLSLKHT